MRNELFHQCRSEEGGGKPPFLMKIGKSSLGRINSQGDRKLLIVSLKEVFKGQGKD